MPRIQRQAIRLGAIASLCLVCACGNAGLFNEPFLNVLVGGQFPVTPGPTSPFVFVRVINNTQGRVVDFILTAESSVAALDDFGDPKFAADGTLLTALELETVRLRTMPAARANEVGYLFACDESPILRIGLGENLDDASHLFLFDNVNDFGQGCGTGLDPLSAVAGNFACGDTVIFQAFDATSSACGVSANTLVLTGSNQPSLFSGPSTFDIMSEVFDSQLTDDE